MKIINLEWRRRLLEFAATECDPVEYVAVGGVQYKKEDVVKLQAAAKAMQTISDDGSDAKWQKQEEERLKQREVLYGKGVEFVSDDIFKDYIRNLPATVDYKDVTRMKAVWG